MAILTVDKPKGVTCSQIVEQYRQDDTPICFSGRLDPMARGKLIILTGDDVKHAIEYDKKDKTYEFEIVLGIQTDTDDILGMVTSTNPPQSDDIIDAFTNYESPYNQKYHDFSSFVPRDRFEGRRHPLWWWTTRTDKKFNCTKPVTIYERKLLNTGTITGLELKNNILTDLSTFKDRDNLFRRNEIVEQWTSFSFRETYQTLAFSVTVSSGFYIRQFVKDLFTSSILVTDINRKWLSRSNTFLPEES